METVSTADSHTFSNRAYKIAIALFIGGTTLDIATTFHGVTSVPGMQEGNPIMGVGMETLGPLAGLFIIKAILVVLCIILLTKLSTYTRRDQYTLTGLSCGLVWGLAGAINFASLFLL